MKNLITLLFLFSISNPLFSQKKEYPPVVKPVSKANYNIVYADDAIYRYTLDIKNTSILNPNTEFIKTIHFKKNGKDIMETVYNTDETQLIDNSLMKSNIKQKVSETEYTVNINKNQVILTNTTNKKRITLNIIDENNVVTMLANPKTGEKYVSLDTHTQTIKKNNLPALYIPSNKPSENSSK